MATDITRHSVVDFTLPPYYMGFHYLALTPQPTNPYTNILKPFDIFGWTWILASLVAVTAFVIFSAFINGGSREVRLNMGIKAYRGLTKQDYDDLSTNSSLKSTASMLLALSFWSLSTVVLSASYCGNLNAYLVAIDYQRPIDTANDIIETGKTLYLPVK